MGMLTIFLAQAGKIPSIDPEEAAYYAAQPLFLALVTDAALISAVAAAVALLLRKRAAVWLFAVSLVLVLFSNIYDIAAGSSRALVDSGAVTMSVAIIVVGLLQVLYAYFMRTRAVLT